jgi:ABC-type multidrug transport system fused ATPase/permease subunit
MERSIFKYIIKYSLKGQIVLLVVTAISMPFVYLSLEVPKIIVNEAIGGQGMPESLFGFEFDQITYLFALCALFLLLVLMNGGFKYFLNVYRGVLGERMLRRLRYELYSRLLRFPLPHFKRVSSGEIIPMITAETEPLGGFIGESYSLPAFQGGLLLTYLFFIFNQDLFLGAAAVAPYPLQMYLIPKLQRRVNQLAKQRVLAARQLANRIGDSVSGITEIHANDTSHYERADISSRLGRIFDIRYQIYRKKFFIKFLNNFLAQITPFFFYSVGGYFVIVGELSLGALVAVLAAYKDLASPWKELLKYYQTKEDIRIKYAQVIEQFEPQHMLDEALLADESETVAPLHGDLVIGNLSFSEDQLIKLVDSASAQMELRQHVLVTGANGSGRDELGRLLARLLRPTGGRITIGEHNAAYLPESIIGRRISYVGQNVFLLPGSVRSNIHYALKHVPATQHHLDEESKQKLAAEREESQRTGNSLHEFTADWIDYASSGAGDSEELDVRIVDLLRVVGLENDIYQLGLRSPIDPHEHSALAHRIMDARKGLREQLRNGELAELVEPFDENRYNLNATVAENLLFGTPTDATFDLEKIASHEYMLRTLTKAGLLTDLLEVGCKVAETMVDLFADLPPGHEFFEQFSFISAEELPEYQQLVARIASQGMQAMDADVQARFLSLAFKLIPTRHRLGLVDENLQARVLAARDDFRNNLPTELRGVVAFFNADTYNAESTLLDNILFGKRAYGHARGQAQLSSVIDSVIGEYDLRTAIVRIGLDYEVGIGGGRLSLDQRQKLALARALLKRPDVLIVNDATSTLDSAQESQVLDSVRKERAGHGLIWISGRAEFAKGFDKVFVMETGKVIEQGTFDELEQDGRVFKGLMQSG